MYTTLQERATQTAHANTRDLVAGYMLGQLMVWTRGFLRPAPGHWLLHSMDSVVAEYTLIQMGRTVEGNYLLLDDPPKPHISATKQKDVSPQEDQQDHPDCRGS